MNFDWLYNCCRKIIVHQEIPFLSHWSFIRLYRSVVNAACFDVRLCHLCDRKTWMKNGARIESKKTGINLIEIHIQTETTYYDTDTKFNHFTVQLLCARAIQFSFSLHRSGNLLIFMFCFWCFKKKEGINKQLAFRETKKIWLVKLNLSSYDDMLLI